MTEGEEPGGSQSTLHMRSPLVVQQLPQRVICFLQCSSGQIQKMASPCPRREASAGWGQRGPAATSAVVVPSMLSQAPSGLVSYQLLWCSLEVCQDQGLLDGFPQRVLFLRHMCFWSLSLLLKFNFGVSGKPGVFITRAMRLNKKKAPLKQCYLPVLRPSAQGSCCFEWKNSFDWRERGGQFSAEVKKINWITLELQLIKNKPSSEILTCVGF